MSAQTIISARATDSIFLEWNSAGAARGHMNVRGSYLGWSMKCSAAVSSKQPID
jgi:hypothetical protein